jgi:hypothetical protein
MTSDSQTTANRANGKKSTGPRTRGGKAMASRNALRHGLRAASACNTGFSDRIERLAKAICREDADPVNYSQALIIAESLVNIARVRAARVQILEQTFERSSTLPELLRLERYERRALSRRRRAIRRLDARRSAASPAYSSSGA